MVQSSLGCRKCVQCRILKLKGANVPCGLPDAPKELAVDSDSSGANATVKTLVQSPALCRGNELIALGASFFLAKRTVVQHLA